MFQNVTLCKKGVIETSCDPDSLSNTMSSEEVFTSLTRFE